MHGGDGNETGMGLAIANPRVQMFDCFCHLDDVNPDPENFKTRNVGGTPNLAPPGCAVCLRSSQAAPDPLNTAGIVSARILMSSHSDHRSIYCMSSIIHCSKGMVLR